jgi:hypothetical protein
VRGVLLALAVCLVLVLGGCGGGDDSASTSSSARETTPTNADTPRASRQGAQVESQEKQKGKQANKVPSLQGGGSRQHGTHSKHPAKPPKPVAPPAISTRPVAGSKRPAPGVKTVKGGDNSVQEYGVEADQSERTEAAIALATYLNARAEGNWSGACSLLAQRPTEQLEKLSGHKAGCAEVLAATGREAPSMPGSSITEVLSFRGGGDISGNPSYLIFKGPPGGTLFSMPMYLESGSWKVGLAQPSELPV